MAKDCPFCSRDPNRPAVEMKPLRALVFKIWRMELAQKGLFILDGDLPSTEVPDSEIPLSGLQIKLVDIGLQIKLIGEFADQVLHPDDRPSDPLYLLRHSQILRKPLDNR